MEKEQGEIDLRSQIDGIDEYQNMVDFIRPLIQQIRQDTIKEMESNLFLKDIVTKTRIDTLRQVLPSNYIYSLERFVYKKERQYIINKAKEIWGFEIETPPRTKKDEYQNLLVEIASMIESGSIVTGALGLSQDSVEFVFNELNKNKK